MIIKKIIVSLVNTIYIFAIFIACNALSIAASQGTLGKQSSGTIEISVQVNQTLSTVSPTELTIRQTDSLKDTNNKPFCIARHGFEHNNSVPYQLTVDNLSISKNSDFKESAFPYEVFLENKASYTKKLSLETGVSISQQTRLNISDTLYQECVLSGQSISIQLHKKHNHSEVTPIPPGLLILMVSPI